MTDKSPGGVIEALERLQRLKEAGAIDEAEFAKQKAAILTHQGGAQQASPGTGAGLSVNPETLKQIAAARKSGGGSGLLIALVVVAVLGLGGYFGAQALNIDVGRLLAPAVAANSGEPAAIDVQNNLAAGPELNVSVSEQTTYPYPGGSLAVTFKILEIQSKMDHVSIEAALVNRANCEPLNLKPGKSDAPMNTLAALGVMKGRMELGIPDFNPPVDLKFGETLRVVFHDCNMLELDIGTDQGGAHYDFK